MRRTAAALLLLCLGVTAGCCLCAAPYDYCAPTFQGGPCGGDCRPHARVGSAFSGPYEKYAPPLQPYYGDEPEGETDDDSDEKMQEMLPGPEDDGGDITRHPQSILRSVR